MSTFTPRQRDALHRRLALAVCWKMATPYQNQANRMAWTVIEAIEENASDAMALRRATKALVEKIEREEQSA